jgi:hypothetical protein
VPPSSYRPALDEAIREYERAVADRAVLDARIAQLQQTIGTLTKLCGLTPTVAFGLTDACRLVLRNAGTPMTAVQVRDRLASIGFDLEKYANSLAAIHTVLKRLEESGEAGLAELDDTTRQAYEFIRSGIIASRVGPKTPAPRGRTRKGGTK